MGISLLEDFRDKRPTTCFSLWSHMLCVASLTHDLWRMIPFASKYKIGYMSLNMHPTAFKMSFLTSLISTTCSPLPLKRFSPVSIVSIDGFAHHTTNISKAVKRSCIDGHYAFLNALANPIKTRFGPNRPAADIKGNGKFDFG